MQIGLQTHMVDITGCFHCIKALLHPSTLTVIDILGVHLCWCANEMCAFVFLYQL